MDREKEHIIADKTMLQVARVTSMVFTPFSIPFLSFLVLFLFSYLRIMPMAKPLILRNRKMVIVGVNIVKQ